LKSLRVSVLDRLLVRKVCDFLWKLEQYFQMKDPNEFNSYAMTNELSLLELLKVKA